jgi:hypothetical protein
MEFTALDKYRLLFWNGSLENPRLVLHSVNPTLEPLHFHRYVSAGAHATAGHSGGLYGCPNSYRLPSTSILPQFH